MVVDVEPDPVEPDPVEPDPVDTIVRIEPKSVASPSVGQELEFSLKIKDGIDVAGFQARKRRLHLTGQHYVMLKVQKVTIYLVIHSFKKM